MIEFAKEYHEFLLGIAAFSFLYYLVIKLIFKGESQGFFSKCLCIISVIIPVWIILYGKVAKYCSKRIKDRFHYVMMAISFLPIFILLLIKLGGDFVGIDVSRFDNVAYPSAQIVVFDDTLNISGFVSINGLPVPFVWPMRS